MVVAEVDRNGFTAAEKLKNSSLFLHQRRKEELIIEQNPLEVCQTPETNQLVGLRTGFSSGATSSGTVGRKEDSEKATRPSQETRRTFFFLCKELDIALCSRSIHI